jgi:ABC-type transport system involved in cytochrome bd biosynthesis fused ATPase/permease subunit
MTTGTVHPQVRAATPRRVLAVSALTGWLAAGASALLFVLLGRVVDDLAADALPTHDAAAVPALTAWVPWAVLLGLVVAVCTGAGAWWSERTSAQAEKHLRAAVVSAVFRGGAVRASAQAGRLLAAATTSVEKTAHYRAGFLGPITASLTTPLLVLLVMAVAVDPVTAGVLTLLVLLVPVLVGGFQRLVRPVGGRYRRSQAALTSAFVDAIQGLETLVLARAAHRRAELLARRGEEHRRSLMRMLAVNQLLILVVDAAFSLGVVVAAAVLTAVRVGTGDLSVGDGTAILLLSTLVIGPVDVVGQFFYIGIAGRASQAQLGSVLGPEPATASQPGGALEVGRAPEAELASEAGRTPAVAASAAPEAAPTPADGRPPAAGTPALLLGDVDAGWADGPTVLSGLSLRVEHGEHVALAGPSGAGKSTVASLLLGHLTARAGTVRVDGIDPVRNPAGARSRIAAVQQRAFHFLGPIEDNQRQAAPAVTEARLWEALELAGLRADVEAMPAGLATPVGEQGALLSGGQSQRLAIAQAWLQDAPILVLDEPTSQVDLAAEEQILAALRRLAADRTVLMIAHRPGAILAADRVIRLDPARPAGDEARPGAAARPGAEAPGSTRAGEGTR